MTRLRDFRLPDLGEGLTEGEILQWLVAVGDEVVLNQPIVEVETAKAAVEVPSPFAGVVTALHHQAGEVVDVGAVIISFDTEPGAGPLDLVPEPEAEPEPEPEPERPVPERPPPAAPPDPRDEPDAPPRRGRSCRPPSRDPWSAMSCLSQADRAD